MKHSLEIPDSILSQIGNLDKIWVYQASRKLTNDEVNAIQSQADHFVEQWAAHSVQLNARAFVLFNLFVVLLVDENAHLASGCSLDASISFIKSLNQQFNIDLLQRDIVAAIIDEQIQLIPLKELSENISNAATLVFNNLILTGKDLKEKWITPIERSWHNKFIEIEHSSIIYELYRKGAKYFQC